MTKETLIPENSSCCNAIILHNDGALKNIQVRTMKCTKCKQPCEKNKTYLPPPPASINNNFIDVLDLGFKDKLDNIIKLLNEADAIEKKLNESGVKCEFIVHD